MTLAELRERAERAVTARVPDLPDPLSFDDAHRLIAALCRVVEAGDGLRRYGVEHDDARISYKSVQVARVDEADYDAARQALDALLREVDGG